MKLWTIQHPDVWETLNQRGFYRADGRRVDGYWRDAHRWMVDQMSGRLAPEYASGRYPVWAWNSPKPDMRRVGHYLPDEGCVRLTLEIEDEESRRRVLLSDFDGCSWHALNNWYFALSDKEYEWWDRVSPDRFEGELPEHLQEMVWRSWERIFDLETVDAAMRIMDQDDRSPQRVQATFEEIRAEEVVRVEWFRGIGSEA